MRCSGLRRLQALETTNAKLEEAATRLETNLTETTGHNRALVRNRRAPRAHVHAGMNARARLCLYAVLATGKRGGRVARGRGP